MAETREGGVYKVGDEWHNAMGEKVPSPSEQEAAQGASGDGGKSKQPPADGLDAVQFASAAARTAAEEAGMTAADFENKQGSGDGFTKPDVTALIEARG